MSTWIAALEHPDLRYAMPIAIGVALVISALIIYRDGRRITCCRVARADHRDGTVTQPITHAIVEGVPLCERFTTQNPRRIDWATVTCGPCRAEGVHITAIPPSP